MSAPDRASPSDLCAMSNTTNSIESRSTDLEPTIAPGLCAIPGQFSNDFRPTIDTSTVGSFETPQTRKPLRQKFAAVDDVVLLRAVNAFRHWRAPVGTSNGIMKVFEDIAVQCGANPEFGVDKPGIALRPRFATLMREFKRDQCRSMRNSGTVEQFEERDRLLLDIIAQTDDWSDKVEADNRVKDAKQRSIESSGALMRRLAMNEFDENEESEGGIELLSPEGSERGRKRAAHPISAQKGKVTKRERLAVVMDALTESLKSASEEEGSKYNYKVQRLALEKEEAEKQRQHDANEAEKRRQHELELEARRQKAEEDRERRMYEFISLVLARNPPKE